MKTPLESGHFSMQLSGQLSGGHEIDVVELVTGQRLAVPRTNLAAAKEVRAAQRRAYRSLSRGERTAEPHDGRHTRLLPSGWHRVGLLPSQRP